MCNVENFDFLVWFPWFSQQPNEGLVLVEMKSVCICGF